MDLSQLERLGAALALGLLIGLQRGWQQREVPDGGRVSGVRTHGLIGLAGGISALIPVALAVVVALSVSAMLIVGYARTLLGGPSRSATGAVVGMLTFALGYVAGSGLIVIALAAAAVTMMILASRTRLHQLLKGMSEKEIEAVARFAIVALVILPLLPDQDFGPYGAWNPHRIWLVVVIVLGLSFAGYVAVRSFGAERGILVTALTGAFVSSTAVTIAYARRIRAGDGAEPLLTGGIALASLVMFVRVQIVAAVVAPFASASLALTMTPALLTALVLALLAIRRGRAADGAGAVKLGNPLDFGPALLLAGLVALLSLVARWALATWGSGGVAVTLAITGMMDVDAAVLAVGGLPAGTLDGWTAGVLLSIPILVNTAIKGGIALFTAGGRAGVRAATPLFAAVLASAAGIALVGWPF